jgi:sRNA-binding protein
MITHSTTRPKITLKVALSPEKMAQLTDLVTVKPKTSSRSMRGKRGQVKRPPCEMGMAVTWLYRTYPKCFKAERTLPLKRSVQNDILGDEKAKFPFSEKILKEVLRHYVYSYPYMKSLLQEDWRYDLSGERIEPLNDKHKTFAQEWLEAREEEKVYKKAMHTQSQALRSN